MNRQSGATLGGLMFFLLLLVLVLYVAYRIVPTYMDYWMVNRTLGQMVQQPSIQNGSDGDIRGEFTKRLALNNVSAIGRADLLIERASGGLKLTVPISVKRPLVGPISLCLDFQAQAGGN